MTMQGHSKTLRAGKSRASASRGAEPATGEAGKAGALGSQGIAGREARIAEAAYFRAQKRGFEPGHELDDWLAAEAELSEVQISSASLQRVETGSGK